MAIYSGLEEREQQKDKAKAALQAQLAANKEWDRRNRIKNEDAFNLKLMDIALSNGSLFSNGMVSGNGKDNKTGMTNREARDALIKNYKVLDDKGNLVDDPNFLAALARIDGAEDPQGFIKLYSVMNPYIKALKKDETDQTFIGNSVRKEIIDVVSKASITGPDSEKRDKIISNIKNSLLDSNMSERINQMIDLAVPNVGSFTITEEPVYTPKPTVTDITEFEKFVTKPLVSRAAAEKSRIFTLMGNLSKKTEMDSNDTALQNWYAKRLGDIERAEKFAQDEKNYGLLASLYSSQFLKKALDQYGNMNRVKELIDPNILNSAKTPIYVPSIEIAKILQNSGILFEGDIVYLTDEAKMARMPKK
tara:strand:+ start:123 stop:1211 length:1089 start_codon:yes stop_codon:yes gene_type:complete